MDNGAVGTGTDSDSRSERRRAKRSRRDAGLDDRVEATTGRGAHTKAANEPQPRDNRRRREGDPQLDEQRDKDLADDDRVDLPLSRKRSLGRDPADHEDGGRGGVDERAARVQRTRSAGLEDDQIVGEDGKGWRGGRGVQRSYREA